jgi:hypothetical protein
MAYNTPHDDIDVLAKPVPVQDKKYVIPRDAKVLPPLASQCKCELAVTEDGLAMVIHTKPLPEGVKWVEYDMDLGLLTFVTLSGSIMELGIKIHQPFVKPLQLTKEMMMVQMSADEKNLETMYPAKLVIRHIGI